MKVLPIQSNYCYSPKNNVRFGECAKVSDTRCAKNLVTHFTKFNRLPFDPEKFFDYIYRLALRAAKEGSKLKFVFCGCSDGTQVFNTKMWLLDKFKGNEYLMPEIMAFDNNKEVIDIAKSGRIAISDAGVQYLQHTFPNKKYIFDKQEANLSDAERENFMRLTGQDLKYSYQIVPAVTKGIEFKESDMVTELGKLNKDTYTILFNCNVGRYNPVEKQKLAGALTDKNLRQDSLVVVGKHDVHNNVDENNNIIEGELSKFPPIPIVAKINEGRFFPMYDIAKNGTVLRKY